MMGWIDLFFKREKNSKRKRPVVSMFKVGTQVPPSEKIRALIKEERKLIEKAKKINSVIHDINCFMYTKVTLFIFYYCNKPFGAHGFFNGIRVSIKGLFAFLFILRGGLADIRVKDWVSINKNGHKKGRIIWPN
jgi:hypothetical protein